MFRNYDGVLKIERRGQQKQYDPARGADCRGRNGARSSRPARTSVGRNHAGLILSVSPAPVFGVGASTWAVSGGRLMFGRRWFLEFGGSPSFSSIINVTGAPVTGKPSKVLSVLVFAGVLLWIRDRSRYHGSNDYTPRMDHSAGTPDSLGDRYVRLFRRPAC